MTRSVIDPITRIEGHLRVEMEVENGVVADAWVSGGCFRGMELVVQNRTPEDAAQIVERICGVCPVSHAHASSIAGDKAYGITISNNARIVRNLLEGAQFLHSHILWLYNLAALDYVNPLNALQANVDDAYAVALENGLTGLLHISQISTQRIKHPGAVLKEGQEVRVKILSTADNKISLSMKVLAEEAAEAESHSTYDYKEEGQASTGLATLLKNIKL